MRWLAAAALAGGVLLGVAGLAGLAGCSSGPPPGPAGAAAGSAAAAGTACGQTRTGVNVPVVIKVTRGAVSCAAALRVERGYAAAIKSGALHGTGGGAPLKVDGWTCQAYPTAQVLRTGDASECHTAMAEVVAVLAPSGAPSATLSPAATGPVEN
jgi:hypothetical protein